MAEWKYLKGSEADFEGAPEWATLRTFDGFWTFFAESHDDCARVYDIRQDKSFHLNKEHFDESQVSVIAQRERVDTLQSRVNDDRLTHDMVNHPKHYTQAGIECIDAIKAATVGKNGIEAVCVANVLKYVWRYEEKNGVEDVKKARWYLERLISELEGKAK